MTEQERPRTEAGPADVLRRAMLAEYPFTGRFQTAQLLDEALAAARGEGRQQAVREAKEQLLPIFDREHRHTDAYLFFQEEVAAILDRVAGLNASESTDD